MAMREKSFYFADYWHPSKLRHQHLMLLLFSFFGRQNGFFDAIWSRKMKLSKSDKFTCQKTASQKQLWTIHFFQDNENFELAMVCVLCSFKFATQTHKIKPWGSLHFTERNVHAICTLHEIAKRFFCMTVEKDTFRTLCTAMESVCISGNDEYT